jgi:hypothetical protein
MKKTEKEKEQIQTIFHTPILTCFFLSLVLWLQT